MSIQTQGLKDEYIPLNEIRRPIPPVLDHQKIDAMVSTLKGKPMESKTAKLNEITAGELPPVDVFKVREKGKNYYFIMNSCHRMQAYDRIAKEENKPDLLVKSKVLPATRKTLKLYLGGSVDEMFEDFDKEREKEEEDEKEKEKQKDNENENGKE
ncbi:uncharacterized protein KGF55_003123 [Candida pseudojiufengensis]|uniref:uncharacterized protein n=1 Tax=Candida pseudojiufengensis TaxID=497109 RepID=UPI00222498D6|nr:uncharacterized protein KGF55_003123 [Candida pseudojiufengensis]KAI5963331.1 hypothetical protein KGF55_003123 [Candida pseudojiufengensis]